MQETHHHFTKIAYQYRQLRTTDVEPLLFIKKTLQKFKKIKAADVGCGAGRYDLKLFEHLGNRLDLLCMDCNNEMLSQLENYLREHGIKNFKTKIAFASKLPIKTKSIDCVFTFNAIHHFPIRNFLREISRILRDDGYLFIYTRLRSQNKETIWGKYFPEFSKKETRLFTLNELKREIKKVKEFSIYSIKFFKYDRNSTLSRLVEQASNHHYSTFCLYDRKEFEESLAKFNMKILRKYDQNNVFWTDRNVMLVLKRTVVDSQNPVIQSKNMIKTFHRIMFF